MVPVHEPSAARVTEVMRWNEIDSTRVVVRVCAPVESAEQRAVRKTKSARADVRTRAPLLGAS